MKTGDPISPPHTGYVGGGMQWLAATSRLRLGSSRTLAARSMPPGRSLEAQLEDPFKVEDEEIDLTRSRHGKARRREAAGRHLKAACRLIFLFSRKSEQHHCAGQRKLGGHTEHRSK